MPTPYDILGVVFGVLSLLGSLKYAYAFLASRQPSAKIQEYLRAHMETFRQITTLEQAGYFTLDPGAATRYRNLLDMLMDKCLEADSEVHLHHRETVLSILAHVLRHGINCELSRRIHKLCQEVQNLQRSIAHTPQPSALAPSNTNPAQQGCTTIGHTDALRLVPQESGSNPLVRPHGHSITEGESISANTEGRCISLPDVLRGDVDKDKEASLMSTVPQKRRRRNHFEHHCVSGASNRPIESVRALRLSRPRKAIPRATLVRIVARNVWSFVVRCNDGEPIVMERDVIPFVQDTGEDTWQSVFDQALREAGLN